MAKGKNGLKKKERIFNHQKGRNNEKSKIHIIYFLLLNIPNYD